jgi:poly(A) polymerase
VTAQVGANARLSDPAWLQRGAVKDLLARLDRDGEEARVVGGAVRNELLHLAVNEIDVATTAIPDEVVRRVEAAGWKAVPTGIEHGTVTVVIGGTPFEVTTLRQDVETYGRKAKVMFGRDWAADAQRRDFTVNALSATADGTVYDYVDGLADIAKRRVRFIGNPATRIAEDYLRILRFFRFHAWYGVGAPDPAGLHACIAAREGLASLSRERVRMELLKLMLAPHATPALAVMAETGLLVAVLGGVPLLASYENTVKAEAAMALPPDAVRRLGALGVCTGEDAERLAERLRLSNAEAERLKAIEQWWRVSPAAANTQGDHAARALLYHLGPESFVDRVLIGWSRSRAGAADRAWHELASLPQRFTAPVFPLKAADLMSRGLAAGPELGAALRLAEELWIEADFPLDRAALEAIADRAAREAGVRLRL